MSDWEHYSPPANKDVPGRRYGDLRAALEYTPDGARPRWTVRVQVWTEGYETTTGGKVPDDWTPRINWYYDDAPRSKTFRSKLRAAKYYGRVYAYSQETDALYAIRDFDKEHARGLR